MCVSMYKVGSQYTTAEEAGATKEEAKQEWRAAVDVLEQGGTPHWPADDKRLREIDLAGACNLPTWTCVCGGCARSFVPQCPCACVAHTHVIAPTTRAFIALLRRQAPWCRWRGEGGAGAVPLPEPHHGQPEK